MIPYPEVKTSDKAQMPVPRPPLLFPHHAARSTRDESPTFLAALLAAGCLDIISDTDDPAAADAYGLTVDGDARIQRGLMFWLPSAGPRAYYN
ncbi:uncharacterized protein FIBRA_01532 [Fibroporia radiculosa]|uniref:Uncharacterized protein n=1 Tax=Fibroporia radiculosa TaxID=599839 RepID=J4H183_9APHY|nr:uncharacterized protein FIBRA_01532 [Fibroporia radiculosa]CCL99514.1 predicted protein [Fibroporia radiculosa]